jgi:DNA-binding GntR family transcriptional regulator
MQLPDRESETVSGTIERSRNLTYPAPSCRNFGRNEKERLADKAYRQILDLILSGDTRPGDHLNERRLGEMLQMSRTPVRDALVMLETEGLITRHNRMGVQIKQMRIDDYMDALQVRMLLEPAVAAMAAGKVGAADLDALEAALTEAHDAARTGQPVDRAQTRWIDDRLHGLIVDSAGNPQLSDIVRNQRRKTQIFDLRNLPERAVDTCREHLALVSALRQGAADEASEAMRHHLDHVRRSIIARLGGY